MSILEPRLQYLQQIDADEVARSTEARVFGLIPRDAGGALIRVIVHHEGAPSALAAAGFQQRSAIGDVYTGEIPVSALTALAAVPGVRRVEGARLLEWELDQAVPESKANLAATSGTGLSGEGVVVGIIDSGIDYSHDCFRKADNSSRILWIWDQWLTPTTGESSPTGYNYGVEYTKANIDAALGTANPTGQVRHVDSGSGHGTHVSGIAAGNGRASTGTIAAGTYTGVAPRADIVVVGIGSDSQSGELGHNMADSTMAIDAMAWIFSKADSLNKPCVINMSLGDNMGPHDGSSLLERAIDNALGTPGRSMVKSAGNAGADGIHARGRYQAGSTSRVQFTIGANDSSREIFDLWYSGRDRLSITVTDPDGNSSAAFAQGAANTTLNLPNGNRLRLWSVVDDTFNHDNRFYLILERGTQATLQQGNWTLNLQPAAVVDGRFSAWIERGNTIARFTGPEQSREGTISTPGTAREVVTVGCYVSRVDSTGTPVGAISVFSSFGPTRDGRIKPDIAAPGERVISARSTHANHGSGPYVDMQGTSMAAPHVTGAIALLLQRHPRLTARQVRDGLRRSARQDSDTGTVPNPRYGHGKLDAQALVNQAYPQPRAEHWLRIQPQVANWPDNAATPPILEVFGQENGQVVIELAWDPQALLAPSASYTGADALRYYNSSLDFNKSITKVDGSTLQVNVPAQALQTRANRLEWVMPAALWQGFVEEARKAAQTPPRSTFSRNLYYRVRLHPTGATEAIAWPADDVIRDNPLAPRLGIIAAATAPSPTAVPDPAAVEAMGGPALLPGLWSMLLTALWAGLPESDPDRQALHQLFHDEAFRTELTVAQRARVLRLWLVAGPTSRARLPVLLDRRVWISESATRPALIHLDETGCKTLVEHLLDLSRITPHPDIAGVVAAEQLVDDVITEILDPFGRINQGSAGTCAPTSIQAMLLQVNPAEYARLQVGLLSNSAMVTLANADTLDVPPGVFQIARYGAAQGHPLFVRTYAELAFQAATLKYAQGSRFPTYDPAADPNAPYGINTVFQQTISGGLTGPEQDRLLEALFASVFTRVDETPSASLRDRFITALSQSRVPVMLSLYWGGPLGSASVGGHAVLALRVDGGRIFFKNPQYPGSRPPTGANTGVSVDNPPRRYEDPASTLESMGDADLALWMKGYAKADTTIP